MRRFRQVFTSLKERSHVSYAKAATLGGFCDLDLILVKATSPDDVPLQDRYVHELLKIFSISPSSSRAFSRSFTRRFGNTQCWRVALKSLLLLHRLLRSLPYDSTFRAELLWCRANGLMSLNPCHFTDFSSSAYEYYTMFIKSYAHLLDEALDCMFIQMNEYSDEKIMPENFPEKLKEIGRTIDVLPQLQSLIDRVMDCRPTGAAARSFIVQLAMKQIIRDSFMCYTEFRKEIVVVLENLIQLPYTSSVAAFSIYKNAASQANQLYEFYDWCKSMGLCALYEYPFIDRIPGIQIKALETFLNGMWQLTESSSISSSSTSPFTSTVQSPVSFNVVDSNEREPMGTEIIVSTKWEKFEEPSEPEKSSRKAEGMEPLIQWEIDNNVTWETLLEDSISTSCIATRSIYSFQPNIVNGHGFWDVSNSRDEELNQMNGLQMQIYNPYACNPFYQPHNLSEVLHWLKDLKL